MDFQDIMIKSANARGMTAHQCFELADSLRLTADEYARQGREKLIKEAEGHRNDQLLTMKQALAETPWTDTSTLWRKKKKYGIKGRKIWRSELQRILEAEKKQ